MGRILQLAFDCATGTTGAVAGVPRTPDPPSLVSVSGSFFKGSASMQWRLRRIIACPLFTAAQLAGAAADVVSAVRAIDAAMFSVTNGELICAGPYSGGTICDPAFGDGLGVAGANISGTRGKGASCGLVVVDPSAGVGIKRDFAGVTSPITVAWSVWLELEMNPFSQCMEFIG